MLVFVSDLHFRDGTAGEHNVPVRAFEGVLADLALHARQARAREVIVVFLGDIFDLLRTERWLDVPEDERPWGATPESAFRMAQRAEENMDAILNHPVNRETFDLLSSRWSDRFRGFRDEPKRVFIAGNHDRLCAQFPSLLRKARQALGADETYPLHTLSDPAYGVLARHGHEHDPYNYEGGPDYSDEDYLKIPIGDLIATELVVRVPYTVMRHPKVQALMPDQQHVLRTSLEQIENVRPVSAVPRWLYYQMQREDWLQDVIEDSLDQVIHEFGGLRFVKEWYRRHDVAWRPWDEANRLQAALFFLDKLRITRLDWVFSLIERFSGLAQSPMVKAAADEFQRLGPEYYYIVYGHTHVPTQAPIQVLDPMGGLREERVYLNTGSWGTRHTEAVDRGFVSWKQLTYLLFYRRDEDLSPGQPARNFPSFETWAGTLKRNWSWEPVSPE